MRVFQTSKKWLVVVFMCVFSVCMASAFDKEITHKDFAITFSSAKNFTAGQNNFEVVIKKDGKVIKPTELKITFGMPEMSGMPKMTEEAQMSASGDKFSGVVSFPHGGTWQIRIIFIVDGTKYQAKSSIDF